MFTVTDLGVQMLREVTLATVLVCGMTVTAASASPEPQTPLTVP